MPYTTLKHLCVWKLKCIHGPTERGMAGLWICDQLHLFFVILEYQCPDIMKRMGSSINIVQRIIERKLNFFGHICRMQDDRLLKQAVFGIMDGKNKRERPKRRWMDDLVDWCNKDICTLHRLAMDRRKWSHIV